jgi:hypothetical protein
VSWASGTSVEIDGRSLLLAWSLAIVLPAGVAWVLREREAAWIALALGWALAIARTNPGSDSGELLLWLLYALGAVLLVLWGVRDRQRLAVNVGVLAFAIAVFGFYFSSLYDKLGRALGLIGVGVIFIGGGWLLERTRRRLLGRIAKDPA